MNRLLYLDFDGVIVVPEYLRKPKESCIHQLNRIISATGCEIVVSSSWQVEYDRIRDLQALLDGWGVVGRVVDVTGHIMYETPTLNGREADIMQSVNRIKPDYWCAIDDSIREGHRMVRTENLFGITVLDADRAIDWLQQAVKEAA